MPVIVSVSKGWSGSGMNQGWIQLGTLGGSDFSKIW